MWFCGCRSPLDDMCHHESLPSTVVARNFSFSESLQPFHAKISNDISRKDTFYHSNLHQCSYDKAVASATLPRYLSCSPTAVEPACMKTMRLIIVITHQIGGKLMIVQVFCHKEVVQTTLYFPAFTINTWNHPFALPLTRILG